MGPWLDPGLSPVYAPQLWPHALICSWLDTINGGHEIWIILPKQLPGHGRGLSQLPYDSKPTSVTTRLSVPDFLHKFRLVIITRSISMSNWTIFIYNWCRNWSRLKCYQFAYPAGRWLEAQLLIHCLLAERPRVVREINSCPWIIYYVNFLLFYTSQRPQTIFKIVLWLNPF